MADSGMKSIDTSVIRNAAKSIKEDNNKLYETLTECNEVVTSLKGNWTGEAAETTISAFETFYTKYSKIYREKLDEYVKFLDDSAGTGYEDTENIVKQIGNDM